MKLGDDDCKHCYEKIVERLDAIFDYIDCSRSGALSSEDLWNGLPKLRRMTNKHNLFHLASVATIRTAVTNEFILKNSKTISAKVTKSEFRFGVLLGIWDRQTDDFGIINDDKRNLKKLRWDDTEVIDKIAMNYVKHKLVANANRPNSFSK